jgi:hypothetical protein
MPTNPTQPRSGQVTIRVVDDIAIVNGRSVRAGEDRDIYQAAIAEVARTYATPAGTAVRARATDRGRTTVLLIQPDGRAEVIQDLDPQPGYTAAAAVATITATVSPAATSHLAHSAGRDLRHRPRNMRCRMALAAGGLVGTAAVVAATVSLTHTPSTSPAAGETTNPPTTAPATSSSPQPTPSEASSPQAAPRGRIAVTVGSQVRAVTLRVRVTSAPARIQVRLRAVDGTPATVITRSKQLRSTKPVLVKVTGLSTGRWRWTVNSPTIRNAAAGTVRITVPVPPSPPATTSPSSTPVPTEQPPPTPQQPSQPGQQPAKPPPAVPVDPNQNPIPG